MLAVQIACVAIVALYLLDRFRRDPEPGTSALRLLLIASASWIGEDSIIHAYGFYQYSPQWWPFLDRVPLLVVVIWPIVIDSASRLADCLLAPPSWLSRRIPLAAPALGAAFVLADASLIEPVSVQAGLWSWNDPGVFHVPPIGILGWALFTFAALLLVRPLQASGPRRWLALLTPLLAPLATHAMLLACWWGALRWVNRPLDSDFAIALAWFVLGGLAVLSWCAALRHRVPVRELLARVPAATFFFALLAFHGRDNPRLVLWTLAFAPPYLTLMALRPRPPALPSP